MGMHCQGQAMPLCERRLEPEPGCPVLQVQSWLRQAGQVVGFADHSWLLCYFKHI